MKFARFAFFGAICLGAMAGCGSDEESEEQPETPKGTVSRVVAQTTTTSVISAVNLAVSANDGPGAAFALASSGAAAFSIITPASAGAAPQSALGSAKQALTTGTCECTGTSCTFVECGTDDAGAVWTIDGSMSWGDGDIQCDLTIAGDFQGFKYAMHEVCDLMVTSTSIDGTMATDGSYEVPANGSNVSASWNSSITFNDVQYSAGGCPASGSVNVSASVTAYGSSYAGSGEVTFDGSGC